MAMSNKSSLVASSYGEIDRKDSFGDGQVFVWSLSLASRPEAILRTQSVVTQLAFDPFDHRKLWGGCANGQIVMWDQRCRDFPALKSPLSNPQHKWPVQGLKAMGSATSPSILSVSSDGRLCQWNTSKLDQPLHNIENKMDEKSSETFSCVTCLGLPQEDTHTYALGTASGSILTRELKVQSSKAEKSSLPQVIGEHFGPITSMH